MAGASTAKKGKGLSFEEKRKRMEEFFHEKQDFFQLKDLEKMVPKEKGIVAQTVKEVLQSLVDDSLVTCEKIGTSNYFWSFPSAALHTRTLKLNNLGVELARLTKMEEDLKREIEEAMVGREDSDERQALIEKFNLAHKELEELDKQLDAMKENDPELHAKRIADNNRMRQEANKWTDNIYSIQTYCTNNFNIPRDQLKEAFNLPSDLEYV